MLAELYKEPGIQRSGTSQRRPSATAPAPSLTMAPGTTARIRCTTGSTTGTRPMTWIRFSCTRSTQEHRIPAGTRQGPPFLHRALFHRRRGPKYYWDRVYKYDIQSASQSIDTLTLFQPALKSPNCSLSRNGWLHGRFATCRTRRIFLPLEEQLFTNKTPTFHWGAATMFHALAYHLRERTSREH